MSCEVSPAYVGQSPLFVVRSVCAGRTPVTKRIQPRAKPASARTNIFFLFPILIPVSRVKFQSSIVKCHRKIQLSVAECKPHLCGLPRTNRSLCQSQQRLTPHHAGGASPHSRASYRKDLAADRLSDASCPCQR